MRAKSPSGRSLDTPGPGSYNASTIEVHKYNKTPNFSFGAAPRDGVRGSSQPGPGQYSPESPTQKTSAKYGFGTSQRKSSPPRVDEPGPGQYQVSTQMGSEGPRFSAGQKRSVQNNLQTPGPGAYSPAGVSATTGSTPKWGFGTSPRDGRNYSENPGPGSYNHDASSTGPKYSFRAKQDVSRIRVHHSPGPGEYASVYSQFG